MTIRPTAATYFDVFPSEFDTPGAAEAIRRSVIETFRQWRQRAAQRRQLATIPDYLLRDIGLSRTDTWAEVNKPFWQE